MKSILLILILFFTLNNICAEESKYREDKGLQVQLLLNGGALIGYHFNNQIFLGVTSITNINIITILNIESIKLVLKFSENMPNKNLKLI